MLVLAAHDAHPGLLADGESSDSDSSLLSQDDSDTLERYLVDRLRLEEVRDVLRGLTRSVCEDKGWSGGESTSLCYNKDWLER